MNTPFIVAEVSANHLGRIERAHELVAMAADIGADAVKFQTFTPEQMVDADRIIEAGPWAGQKAIKLYSEAHTPREWHSELFWHARRRGILAFSSVFHQDDVDFLETLDCPIYKISSFEIRDLELIRYASRTGKPMIISTGMAQEDEIQAAATAADASPYLTLLKCTSAYPTPAGEINLATMPALAYFPRCMQFGLSDHTEGIGVAVAAVALGASVIEKHLTISRADGGPDAAFSMEPSEFAQMVTECRRAAQAIGTMHYGPTPGEAAQMLLRRKPGGKRGD